MGFALSILYLLTSYLSPATLFGPLALFRIELILAVLVLFVSLPALMKSSVLKAHQSLALIGLAFAVVLSVLFGEHWVGGSVHEFLDFIPNAFAYLLVCLHCNSKKKLQVIVLMLLSVCLFVIAQGSIDLYRGLPENGYLPVTGTPNAQPQSALTYGELQRIWNIEHPYFFPMRNEAGEWFYRLRGQGFINDPNDFAQLTVCLIPLQFIFWRPKKKVRNAIFVLLPVCALFFGVYLTHSRGAIIALVAVLLVATSRRIGVIPAVVLAGALFVAAQALHVSGGREISASAGADRTILWGEGLQMLKSHPLFGVGFGNFAENSDEHLTAHNSLVVCAAELGLFGLFFWSMFLLPTVRDALMVASPKKVTEGEPLVPQESLYPQTTRKTEIIDKAEVNRLGRLMVLSLTGFLVQGMFLSRAFAMTLFLLGGMTEVIFDMALRRGMIAPRMPLERTLRYAFGFTILLVPFLYIGIRFLNLMR
jgi:O-antigen ligase